MIISALLGLGETPTTVLSMCSKELRGWEWAIITQGLAHPVPLRAMYSYCPSALWTQ